MSKLHKLLKWYSIDRAAERLSISLEDTITRKDIFQLALENKLSIRIPLQQHLAQAAVLASPERTPRLASLGIDEDVHIVGEAEAKERTWAKYALFKFVQDANEQIDEQKPFLMFDPVPDKTAFITGNYKLVLEKHLMSQNWLNNLRTGVIENVISMDGIIVADDDGQLWRLLDNNEGHITPRLIYPNEAIVGLTKEDLEEFEESLTDKPENTKTAITKKNQTLSLLVYGMAVTKYRFDPEAKRSSVTSKISTDLSLLGINLDDDTIREHLRSGADYAKTKT